jgi:hypothetical protein
MYESKTHVLSGLTKKEATNLVLFNIKKKYQHCPTPSLPQQHLSRPRRRCALRNNPVQLFIQFSFPEKIPVYICMYCVGMYCK